MRNFLAIMSGIAALLGAAPALAAQPEPWQARFQPAATSIMEQITWFEQYTLWFIVPIVILVMVLLAWAVFRYRASANPTPSRTSHNTLIEVVWTVGPVVILLFLAVPSFQLLTAQYTPDEDPQLTVKATANQWNWDYEYQVDDPLYFNSAILAEDARAEAGKEDKSVYPRLLAVDNELVVPVDTTVRVLVTASDVIHAFAMPAFGIKVDAVPGRINETWFNARKEGLYYGQCSELCGKDHAFMPIAIRVVSNEQYENWAVAARDDLGTANKALMAAVEGDTKVAAAGN
ncbi:cytochrome c oxidase subunit II [Mesorhizobium xinjiangense]|uniref:cytochrome c oxidase subunit II n=1 Tax=Mesorhizobium xinjiangense TaxID=2678685 RepID=UPI0012EDA254|nr:cytochrome c oxidase subunit II [Mesorhizobium xinjiangense]